jgi:hypothetical protein
MGRVNAQADRIFMPDPSVLIYYRDICLWALTLFSLRVSPIYAVRQVLSLAKIRADHCAELAIRIIDPDTSALLEAGKLSFYLGFEESLCCLACRTFHYTCVTNDYVLARCCTAAGITVVGGLELLGCLVRVGSLPPVKASAAAHAMRTSNPGHITSDALSAFDGRLDLND